MVEQWGQTLVPSAEKIMFASPWGGKKNRPKKGQEPQSSPHTGADEKSAEGFREGVGIDQSAGGDRRRLNRRVEEKIITKDIKGEERAKS